MSPSRGRHVPTRRRALTVSIVRGLIVSILHALIVSIVRALIVSILHALIVLIVRARTVWIVHATAWPVRLTARSIVRAAVSSTG